MSYFDDKLAKKMEDPEYAKGYKAARARIDTVTLFTVSRDECGDFEYRPRVFRNVPWCHTHDCGVDADGICIGSWADEVGCVWGVALVEVPDE